MEFADKLRTLAARAREQVKVIHTEEAAKTALVMPFLDALGYNIFDPREVVPEFTADVGTKKGEKVDYAICQAGEPSILIECKWGGKDMKIENASQLFRYFAVTSARCAILTDGLSYHFYSDIDQPNRMDIVPFFSFDLLDFSDQQVDELGKFSKSDFDVERLANTAAFLKYSYQVKQKLQEEVASPSEEFVRFFAKQIYPGTVTASVREQFSKIVKVAFADFIRERINDRFKSAMEEREEEQALEEESGEEDIITTQEEIDAYNIVRAIACRHADIGRIVMRDAKSYCPILFDDNNRKPIVRLYLNSPRVKHVGFFDGKDEDRIEIQTINELYNYSERIEETLKRYLSSDSPSQ